MPSSNSFISYILSIVMLFTSFFQSMFGITPSDPTPVPDPDRPNVIMLIGDGMGCNSIAKTKLEEGVTHLALDDFTYAGYSATRSANNEVTDSAAGGSALATGLRINNDCIAVYPDDMNAEKSYPMSLTELALSLGMTAGVITTDKTSGATPAAFTAHTRSRNDEKNITTQQLKSGLTLIWGAATESFDKSIASANGFTGIYNKSDMDALKSGSRSFAQFNYDNTWRRNETGGMPTLAQMTDKAIELLDSSSEGGFFLMVEGAHIDINSHSNNGQGMKEALLAFDDAVAVALEFAKADGNTIVVVTADHETGGITYTDGQYVYTKGYHTGVNVPLLVYGATGFIENGETVNNYQIARKIALRLGAETFPITCSVKSAGISGLFGKLGTDLGEAA